MEAHIENLKKFGVPVVVAVNRFHTDTDKELEAVRQICDRCGARCAMSEVFAKGGAGGIELAQAVVEACEEPSCCAPIYGDDLTIQEKIEKIATTMPIRVSTFPSILVDICSISSLILSKDFRFFLYSASYLPYPRYSSS